MGWLAGIIFTFSNLNVVYVKTLLRSFLPNHALYESRDNAIASADLWSCSTIDNHDAHASSEDLFELPRERDRMEVPFQM